MKIFFTCCLWLVVCTTITARAQEKNEVPPAGKSSWQFELNYQNDNVYLGRKDSVKLPYITPSVGYFHKSGLFISTSLSYLAAATNSRIDLVAVEGGYHMVKKQFEAQLTGISYFYNNQSTSVTSEVNGSIDLFTARNFGFIKPSLQGTVNFGTTPDINLTTGLEHTFYLDDDKLDITPSVFVNAGTQNYYGAYYSKRRYGGLRKNRRGTGVNYVDVTEQVEDASKMKVLDYELNLPVNYTYKNFSFNFTPSYAIPVNPAILTVTVKTASGVQHVTRYPEKLTNSFYFSFGVSYGFP